MNQMPWRLIPERNRCDGMAAAVEYDDGNPATVMPAVRTARPAPGGLTRVTQPADGAATRLDLASVAREAAVDYDDGDPATILT